MNKLFQFLASNFNSFFLVCVLWVVGNVLFTLWRRGKKPKINKENVLYEERWQSGRSFRSFFTQFGGARNCLNTIFFKDHIVVKLHFPFYLFYPGLLGLEHTIPYRRIISCGMENFFGMRQVVLVFTNEKGQEEKLAFTAKDPEKVQSFCKQGYK